MNGGTSLTWFPMTKSEQQRKKDPTKKCEVEEKSKNLPEYIFILLSTLVYTCHILLDIYTPQGKRISCRIPGTQKPRWYHSQRIPPQPHPPLHHSAVTTYRYRGGERKNNDVFLTAANKRSRKKREHHKKKDITSARRCE